MRLSTRGLAALAGIGLLLTAILAQPPTAAAFPVSGCQLTITSLDADGSELDSAVSGMTDATQDDPLVVTWSGTLRWTRGNGAEAVPDGSWHIEVFGLPTPLRGSEATSRTDTLQVSESLPFRFAGLFHVSGGLAGPDGACSGSGWLRVIGEPMNTVPWTLGLALLLLGLALLAVGARGRWLPAILGGVLVGTGGTLMMVLYAALPLGEATPAAFVAIGAAIGLLAGWHGSRQRGGQGASPRSAD